MRTQKRTAKKATKNAQTTCDRLDRMNLKDRLAGSLCLCTIHPHPSGLSRVSFRSVNKVINQSACEYDEQWGNVVENNIETLPVSSKVANWMNQDGSSGPIVTAVWSKMKKPQKENEPLSPKFTPNLEEKEGPFKQHDIIWAPWGEIYFPAVVVSCDSEKIYFYWVKEPRRDIFSFSCCLDEAKAFDDEERNLQLKDLGMQSTHFEKFEEAYELVTRYLMLSSKTENLNAIHFLTKSPLLDPTIDDAKDTDKHLDTGTQTSDHEEEDDVQIIQEIIITPPINPINNATDTLCRLDVQTSDNEKNLEEAENSQLKETNNDRMSPISMNSLKMSSLEMSPLAAPVNTIHPAPLGMRRRVSFTTVDEVRAQSDCKYCRQGYRESQGNNNNKSPPVSSKRAKSVKPNESSSVAIAQSPREYKERRRKSKGNKETFPVSSKRAKSINQVESFTSEFPLILEEKEGPFKEHDIIWAPWGETYFPAVVVSCTRRRVYYYWANEYHGDNYRFNCPLLQAIAFDDEDKNRVLRDMGEQSLSSEQFQAAYDLVIQYFERIKTENLNATEFLTRSPVLDSCDSEENEEENPKKTAV